MQSYAIPASASAVMARYGNIIFLDRPAHDGDLFSRRHPAMTRLNRAKIFAPFAALVGFDERVRRKEVAYVPKVELDADEEWELNRRLMILHKRTANSRLARANPGHDRRDRNLFRRIGVAMKRILVIYTGGTIGMVATPNGYAPEKELC